MVVYLTEVVPRAVRASGFSLAYSLATAVGGFTPFIVTWLIGRTGNLAVPGLWLTAAAIISLAAILFAHRNAEAGQPRLHSNSRRSAVGARSRGFSQPVSRPQSSLGSA